MNNAMLNIQVRVIGRQAVAQLNSVAAATAGVNAAATKGGGSIQRLGQNFHTAMMHGEKFGKNLQWVGRQLTWNFTLPLGLAGYAATKWALENETAMTKVRKVYGDLSYSGQRVKEETDALATSFELLSSRFGEHQAEVIEVGAAWAAAGSAGVGLAKNVRSTLEASIIGEMELEEATEALIATMAAFGFTADELGDQLAILNIIENETAAQFSDLILVIQRAAGAARTGGVDLRYLAAMAAQLVPATGNAARAGSALRTMISRIMSPTARAADELNRMGLEVETLGWTSLNFIERMERMSESWQDLTASERAYITSTIASRWQVNRFDVLMRGFIDTHSFYKKALEASSDQTAINAQYQRELLAVLESNPRKLKIMTNVLKNEMSRAMVQLLPAIVGFVRGIAALAKSFSNLHPNTQKLILSFLLMLAILGPIIQFLGASILLVSQLGKAAFFAGRGFLFVAKNVFPIFAAVGSKAFDAVAFSLFNLAGAVPKVLGGMATASGGAFKAIAMAGYRAFGAVAVAAKGAAIVGYEAIMRILSPIYAYLRFVAISAARVIAGVFSAMITTAVNWSNIFLAIHARTAAGTAGLWGGFKAFWVALWRFTQVVIMTWGSWMFTYMRRTALLVASTWSSVGIAFTALRTMAVTMAVGTFNIFAGMFSAIITTAVNWRGIYLAIQASTAAGTTTIWGRFAAWWVGLWRFARLVVMTWGSWMITYMRRTMILIVKPILTALAAAVTGIAAALGVPIWAVVAVIAAVVAAIVVILNDDLRGGFLRAIQGIVDGLASLPSIVAQVFRNVVRVIAAAMRAVIEWLSYLNPFARHSPSLVDNVKAGVATILDQYARLRHVPDVIRRAAAAQREFAAATVGPQAQMQDIEYAHQREQIVAVAPNAGPAVDAMIASIKELRAALVPLAQQIDEQERLVVQWEQALAEVEQRLEREKQILQDLEDQLDSLGTALDGARDKLSELGRTPIEGMRAMEDQIFANEMAQKRLRLEILKMEEAGQSIEDLQRRFAALNGTIELLRGEREELRLAGAGSDVLGRYDQEIAALEKQRESMEGQTSEVDKLRKELEELQRTGEILELTKSITFDEQLRQIDQMINGMNELPFDEIVRQIEEQQQIIKELQPEYDRVKDAVDRQREAVEKVQDEHDRVNDKLQDQKDTLSELESAYSDIESEIRDMEAALSDFISLAKSAESIKSGGGAGGGAGDGRPEFGDYEVPGGGAILGPEGGLPEIEDFNKLLEEELGSVLGEMDIFAPIKDAWNDAWGWIKGTFAGIKEWLFRNLSFEGLGNVFGTVMEGIKTAFSAMGTGLKWVWDNVIYPTFKAIWDFVEPILGPIFQVLQTIVETVWNAIGTVITWAWNSVIKPVWDAIWGFLNGFMIPIFTLFKTIADIVWTAISKAIKWAWDSVIKPVWDAIWGFLADKLGPKFEWFRDSIVNPVWEHFKTFIGGAWDVVKGVFEGIISFVRDDLGKVFTWLRDEIIIPVWNKISEVTSSIWGGIQSTIATVWNGIASVIETVINGIASAFNIIAGAVNAVASFVGADSRVTEMSTVSIPRAGGGGGGGSHGGDSWRPMAKGGIMTPWGFAQAAQVGAGFITDGVRAIVGEGSRHPEYVIPTDPRHRDRAMSLYGDLGSHLFAKGGQIPALGLGDIIGDAIKASDPTGLADMIAGGAKKIAETADAAFSAITQARGMISGIASEPVRAAGNWVANEAFDWVTDQIAGAGKTLLDVAKDFNPANPIGGIINAVTNEMGGRIPQNPIDLATGGRLRIARRTGGTLLRVGEGRHDEEVQVKPIRTRDSEGGKTYNFYGDLSFPNITDPDDAEEFIRNLESLV